MREYSVERHPRFGVPAPSLDAFEGYWAEFCLKQAAECEARRQQLLSVGEQNQYAFAVAMERYICLKVLIGDGLIANFAGAAHYVAPNIDEIRTSFSIETRQLVVEVENDEVATALHTAAIIMGDPILSAVEEVICGAFMRSYNAESGTEEDDFVCSIRLRRSIAQGIDFRRINVAQCIKALGGRMARRKGDKVMPFLRATEQSERTSGSLISISTMSAAEFERLITTLLSSLGLEAERTRGSWDGGIDCVAHDPRPIVGGRVLVQAKRYKEVVAASAVRDLYGTLVSQGASKGILMTSGRFGPTSFDFARGKPLELVDGTALRELLKKHLGIIITD